MKDLAMYILVNEDIKINKGKLAGQVGHAVAVYFYRYYNQYRRDNRCGLINSYMETYQKKIILYHSQLGLEILEQHGYISIRDKGWTDLEPNTLTCVNLGILDKNNIPEELSFIKELKLCR